MAPLPSTLEMDLK